MYSAHQCTHLDPFHLDPFGTSLHYGTMALYYKLLHGVGLALVGRNGAVPLDEFLHHTTSHLDTSPSSLKRCRSIAFMAPAAAYISPTMQRYANKLPKDNGATSRRSIFSTSSVPATASHTGLGGNQSRCYHEEIGSETRK